MVSTFKVAGYSNHSIVGRGGFGTVFRARQDAFGRDVAIKVFDARAEDGDDIAAFERECRALGALDSSPNIITVYHAGFSESSEPYIVMEFAPGGSLGQRLREHGPLPSSEVTLIGIKVANALAVAHKGGVIHRDVKPSNILIGHDGGLLLADFGIASMAGGTRTATGNLSTTLEHAAPEVLNGERPTARSDIYSLGSTLFTLLYGTPPFAGDSGDSLVAIITRVLTAPLPDLRSRGIEDSLATVIETALDRDPSRRYETAKDFAEALGNLELSVTLTPVMLATPPTDLSTIFHTASATGRFAETEMATTALSAVTRVIIPGEQPLSAGPTAKRELSPRSRGVILLAGVVVAIIAICIGVLGSYARAQYYVGYQGQRVVVFQGVPNGLAGWGPTAEWSSYLSRSDLTPAQRASVGENISFPSEQRARDSVSRFEADFEERTTLTNNTTSTTTSPTSTTSTTTP